MDLPFVSTPAPNGTKRISGTDYRFGHDGAYDRGWTAPWRAWHVLSDFTDTPAWRNRQRKSGEPPRRPEGLTITGWKARLTAGGATLTDAVNAEIDALIQAAEDERADAMGEILSQSSEFISQFLGLLCARSGSHRATGGLLEAASLVGLLSVQYFKQIEDRRRPSQVCPALRPPFEVPGHSAYPSGHATQSFLIALSLEAAFADGSAAVFIQPVQALAERIARNREIAGVHYRSDTEGGRELAGKSFEVLKTIPRFRALIAAAKAEWA